MTRFALASVLCLLTAFQGKPAPDEAVVRDVVRQYLDARERGDARAVAALFTDDADQLTSSGEWRRGRDEIVRGTLASTQRTGGTRAIAIERVRFPAADVAIADGRYDLTDAKGATRRMWSSFVFVRQGGQWRIASIRNMLPAQ
jgi:uncharacterized protein (TIGR02246 family)